MVAMVARVARLARSALLTQMTTIFASTGFGQIFIEIQNLVEMVARFRFLTEPLFPIGLNLSSTRRGDPRS
jgi:hypothetical protein